MIIGVINNKGGVLKTTLSTNLAASLSLDGKRVILLDLDGQGNVAATFGENPNNLKYTVMDFLKGECKLDDVILVAKNGINILPSNDELNFFDLLIKQGDFQQSDLKLLISKLNQLYDYVIIDTPPTMSTIVATVLSVVNLTIIPFEPDQYAILGLRRITEAAKEFIEKSNHNMKIVAVPTKVNTRVTIHNEIIEQAIRPKLTAQGIYVTKNYVSATTKSTASVGYERVPIVLSIIKSRYQDEYHAIKKEILDYLSKPQEEPEKTDKDILFNNYGMNKL